MQTILTKKILLYIYIYIYEYRNIELFLVACPKQNRSNNENCKVNCYLCKHSSTYALCQYLDCKEN